MSGAFCGVAVGGLTLPFANGVVQVTEDHPFYEGIELLGVLVQGGNIVDVSDGGRWAAEVGDGRWGCLRAALARQFRPMDEVLTIDDRPPISRRSDGGGGCAER